MPIWSDSEGIRAMNESVQPTVKFETKEFSFTGTGKEYFGIWIVNLLLSIITLGIYTAWAKVRRLRYFYGNTWLDGHNFEYHAKPLQILIGRIIVVSYLVFTQVVANFYPVWGLILILPYLIALPWVINKAISFNARMTSYRNVRLGFEGSYWSALGIFILMPFAVMLASGLIAPIASQMSSNYIGNNTRYGNLKFETHAPLGPLYGNLGMSFLFSIAGIIIFGLAAFGVVAGSGLPLTEMFGSLETGSETEQAFAGAAILIFVLGFYAVFIFAFIFYGAGVRNVAINSTILDGVHRFKSTLSRLRYVWIIFSNFILVICTIGMLRPWAAVRTWRYLMDNTALIQAGEFPVALNVVDASGNAATAEYLDIDGIDFGL